MGRSKEGKPVPKPRGVAHRSRPGRQCDLCGKTARLTTTECCGNTICADEENYVLFSYARNSCYRNHRRFTLCGYHHAEEHPGSWKECASCRTEFETEMYVYYGTNEYNFEKLEKPPSFEPTRCATCDEVINLAEDGFSERGDDYYCESCSEKELQKLLGKVPPLEPDGMQRPAADRTTRAGKHRSRSKRRPR